MIARFDTLAGTWTPADRRAGHRSRLSRTVYLDSASNDPSIRQWFQSVENLASGSYYSPEKRRLCRARCREEFDNNAYARRIGRIYAETVVGIGPQIAVYHAGAAGKQLEKLWRTWSRAIGLGEKLRLIRLARLHSGEGFAELAQNPRKARHNPLPLDLRIFEADRVETPMGADLTRILDGLELDSWQQVTHYHVARAHPGDRTFQTWINAMIFDRLPADRIIHSFEITRPEQRRGIPEMQSALILLRVMREFTLSVCEASTNLAKNTIFFETDIPPDALAGDGEEEDAPPPTLPAELPTVPIQRGRGQFLPENWKASPVKAEQPTATYEMFTGALIAEVGASIGMPENLARGSSKNFNFASGRLDHLTFKRSLDIDRDHIERHILDRLLAEFMSQAHEMGLVGSPELPEHDWHWHAVDAGGDPAKEQRAAAERVASGFSSIQREASFMGSDIRENIAALSEDLGKSEDEIRELIARHIWPVATPGSAPGSNPATQPNPPRKPTNPGDHAEGDGDGDGEQRNE